MTNPEDPMTPLAQSASQMHELYLQYVAAGFTEAQALELVKAVIIGSLGGKA